MILALDTTLGGCSVALGNGERIHAERHETITRGHAERLIPMIDETVNAAGSPLSAIKRIIVLTGPGSFAGARVGVAATRALALALGVPATGISALELMAWRLQQVMDANPGQSLGIALNVGRGEVLAQLFSAAAGLPEPETPPLIHRSSRDFIDFLAPAAFCGGRLGEQEIWCERAPDQLFDCAAPQAQHLLAISAALGERHFSEPVKPFYVRAPDIGVSRTAQV